MLGAKHGKAGMGLTDRELEDKVEALVRRKHPRLKLTEEDISEWLLGDASYRPHVNRACRRLVDDNRLVREGGGVAYDPYWCRPWFKDPFKGRRL
jgi:hypothetical protein